MTPSIRTRAQLVKLSRSSSLPVHTPMPTPVPRLTWWQQLVNTSKQPSTKVEVRSYKSDRAFQRDAQKRLNRGWQLIAQTTTPGHVKVGKTFAFMILTGGLSLLGGAARTSDIRTATWIRA